MSSRATISAFKGVRPSLLRSLHTSRPALYYPPTDLPPTPSGAEALGFRPQANRQRQLPEDLKINIPKSGRQDIVDPRQRPNRENRRDAPAKLKGSAKPAVNVKAEDDFFSGSDLASSSGGPSPPRSRRSLQGVSTDVVSGSAVPPDVARRQRQQQRGDRPRGPGQARAGGQAASTQGRDRQGAAGGRDRKTRTGASDISPRNKKVMLPKRQLTFETTDHSEQGLFGKKSLVNDTIAGSVELGLGHPRKTLSLRQAKSSASFPIDPLPILSAAPARPAEQAIQIASWSAALNGSIRPFAKTELYDTVAAQLKR
ncbi:hypothetical protein IAU60_003297 [Kwoniella sp. DSM 27419]